MQVHSNGPMLDDEILADPEVQEAIKNEGKVHRTYDIMNVDRSTLGRIGGVVAKQHGDSGFAGKVQIDFNVSKLHLVLLYRCPMFYSHCILCPLQSVPKLVLAPDAYSSEAALAGYVPQLLPVCNWMHCCRSLMHGAIKSTVFPAVSL